MFYPFVVFLQAAESEKDYSRAALLYYKALLAGSDKARDVLAGDYPTTAVEPNATKQDEDLATFSRVLQYLMGLGVARDDTRAFNLLNDLVTNPKSEFSDNEKSDLYNLLGWLHTTGRGTTENAEIAVAWFEK